MERISAAEGRKPNLLIIVADQLRHDCVGWSGGRSVRSPHLDQLASEGMAFRQAYSPIPVCGPARQAFVCGQRPETYGGLWNPSLGLPVKALEPDSFSWARSLEMEGYRNVYLGKWDVNPDHDPTSYGYGEYIDSERLYRDYLKSREPAVTYSAGFWGKSTPFR
ncbi:sulfatase-like hydrolase/transferase [Paenibacillus sp. CC-CFT747]|nr:sulfatase-like hydrolase/transferase [Paenibacillus sp. CC-CFT747]